MANKLYIGNSVLVDLSNYYNKSEVDTAISNVDVSDQLSNYVEKDGSKVLSDNNFTDALKTKLEGLSNFDPTSINSAISAIESTLGDITGDGAAVTSALDTWNEIKAFVADYTNASDLQDLINTTTSNIQTWVGQQGFLDQLTADTIYLASADAEATYLTKLDAEGIYLSQSDAEDTYLTQNDAASTYQTAVTGLDATVVTKANGAVQNGGGVSTILKITQSDFNALATKNANTLYIVEDDPVQAGS